VVGPIILIGLGGLFLAQNMGYIDGAFWLNVWRFWPLLLVLGGVEMIFGRSGWLGTLITTLIAFAALAIVAWAAMVGTMPYWTGNGWWTGSVAPAAIERVVEETGNVRQATIDLRHNAGRLEIGALPAESTKLVEGDLAHPENATIYRRFDRRGDQAELRLRDSDRRDFPFAPNTYNENWVLRLSPAVAYNLQVESGASELNLDLRTLQVTGLRIEAGASAVKVVLPEAAGRTTATVKAGAAGVDITVPEGVAARIHNNGGLSGTSIDEARFPRVGNYYQSPDFATAANRVEISIETGISGVTVR
jgi:hypothetical protein